MSIPQQNSRSVANLGQFIRPLRSSSTMKEAESELKASTIITEVWP